MTADEQAILRSMSTSRVRRNFWLCQKQIEMCEEKRLNAAAEKLLVWQAHYLDELVRRSARV